MEKKLSSTTELAELLINGRLKAALVRRGVPRDIVEDIVQDVFFEMAPRLDSIDNPWWYAFKCGWNLYLKVVRRPPPDELPQEIMDTTSSPEAAAIAQEQMREVLAKVKQLPKKLREYVEFYLKGETDEDICREMGVSETTLRVIKHRARKTLAQLLRAPKA